MTPEEIQQNIEFIIQSRASSSIRMDWFDKEMTRVLRELLEANLRRPEEPPQS